MILLYILAALLLAPVVRFCFQVIRATVTNTGHMTGGTGWNKDTIWTAADQERADTERSIGYAAAVEAGLIAPALSQETLHAVIHQPCVHQ